MDWIPNQEKSQEDFFGQSIIIPNKFFTENAIKNISAQLNYKEEFLLFLDQATPAQDVQSLMNYLREMPVRFNQVLLPVYVSLDSVGEYMLVINVWYSIGKFDPHADEIYQDEYSKRGAVRSDVHLDVLREIQMRGIKMAEPIRWVK